MISRTGDVLVLAVLNRNSFHLDLFVELVLLPQDFVGGVDFKSVVDSDHCEGNVEVIPEISEMKSISER